MYARVASVATRILPIPWSYLLRYLAVPGVTTRSHTRFSSDNRSYSRYSYVKCDTFELLSGFWNISNTQEYKMESRYYYQNYSQIAVKTVRAKPCFRHRWKIIIIICKYKLMLLPSVGEYITYCYIKYVDRY